MVTFIAVIMGLALVAIIIAAIVWWWLSSLDWSK